MTVPAQRANPGGVRILDRLRDEGRISAAQYESFYHQAKRSGERVEESILETGVMNEGDLMKYVAALYKTRFVSTERLSKAEIDRATLDLVPRRVAERLQCCPILHDKRTQTLSVVAFDLEEDVGKQIQVLTGLRDVRVFVARPAAVRAAIRRFYGGDPHAFAAIGSTGAALGLDAFERAGGEVARGPSTPAAALGGLDLDLGGGLPGWDDRTPVVAIPAPVAQAPRAAPAAAPPIDLTPIAIDGGPKGAGPLEWESYLETINVLVTLLDAARGELRGHSSAVARLSRKIAERLGLPEDERNAIVLAAYLHDVGKAGTYHLTLLNVSRFDGHKLQAQRSHDAPARMLDAARLPPAAIDILGHLFERWDGQGFPGRQAGKDIPLGSRIVALAETYSDLTVNPKNPYRRTLAPNEAVDVLRQLATQLFDPMLVDVLRTIVIVSEAGARSGALTRVLVVDPDREETTLLQLRLEEAGHEVSIARDRAEAEKAAREARFDLVLSELELGGDDGFGVVSALRAIAPDAPLVLLTRKADGESVARGFELGVADFLVKPVSAELVVAKTTQLLEAAARKRSSGLAGSLRDMALPDVLQALANGRKTGMLRVTSGAQAGQIEFLDGAVVNARFGKRAKADAVYAMLALKDGDFALDPAFRPADRSIQDSCEALLLEGMRRIDEGQV